MRRAISNACLASLFLPIWLAVYVGAAAAQSGSYPSKPIHWIVPYTAGSFVDVFARKLAPVVAREMNGVIVIENRPGASGVIGATEVAKAAPDGYTFLYAIADPLIAATVLVKDIPYDPFKNFTLITKVQSGPPMLIANPNNKANSLREFLELAKTERTTYGSFGPGSFPQLMMEQLALDAGVKLEEVAYRSPPQAIQEVTSNQTSATFTSPPTAKSFQDSGRAKVFAVAGPSRLAAFPNTPTIQELGFNSLILRNPVWSGLFGPAALPSDIVQANVKAIHRAIKDPELMQWASSVSVDLLEMTSAEFQSVFWQEYDAVTALIRKANIKDPSQN
jgi:tripartite-type tricarboxylate transporter receptor subunit TctC